MARPRVFISSTFYDLKHIRSSLESFVKTLGYEPVLSEKGNIAFSPDVSLDESCYREVRACDLFVLIIGGRYGSPTSDEQIELTDDFYERYESITKREYESAVERDIPVYILIDRSVYTEYETFKKNRDKTNIQYAHVDSVSVFNLIDEILNKVRNNPVHQFDRHTEIETWLREQWAGLLKEMLSRRTEQRQLTSLANQVSEMANINTTLKRYLEEIVSKVSEEKAKEIIEDEDVRLAESKRLQMFSSNNFVQRVISLTNVTIDVILEIFTKAISLEDIAARFELADPKSFKAGEFIKVWRDHNNMLKRIDEVRAILDLPPLEWESSGKKKGGRRKKSVKS